MGTNYSKINCEACFRTCGENAILEFPVEKLNNMKNKRGTKIFKVDIINLKY